MRLFRKKNLSEEERRQNEQIRLKFYNMGKNLKERLDLDGKVEKANGFYGRHPAITAFIIFSFVALAGLVPRTCLGGYHERKMQDETDVRRIISTTEESALLRKMEEMTVNARKRESVPAGRSYAQAQLDSLLAASEGELSREDSLRVRLFRTYLAKTK